MAFREIYSLHHLAKVPPKLCLISAPPLLSCVPGSYLYVLGLLSYPFHEVLLPWISVFRNHFCILLTDYTYITNIIQSNLYLEWTSLSYLTKSYKNLLWQIRSTLTQSDVNNQHNMTQSIFHISAYFIYFFVASHLAVPLMERFSYPLPHHPSPAISPSFCLCSFYCSPKQVLGWKETPF